MEGYLTNYYCTDSGTTMYSVLCIFGLLAANIVQQQFYSAWYTWNVLLKSVCLCCAFRYHFLAWECCRRRSLYGRQLSKRRSATYTRLKEGNALGMYHLQIRWYQCIYIIYVCIIISYQNIAKGTTDLRVEFISQGITQILIEQLINELIN